MSEARIAVNTIVVGDLIDTPSRSHLRVRRASACYVAVDGTITAIETIPEGKIPTKDVLSTLVPTCDCSTAEVVVLPQHHALLPGLIDTHIHAPQFSFAGCATDMPLLKWLDSYTFPTEQQFHDVEHARSVYTALVKRLLSTGTTTALYYATIHVESSVLLAKICMDLGQRAFVGKVSMDRNSPSSYVEADAKTAISNAEIAVKAILSLSASKDNALVQPVVTPRFIPTCSPELLRGLAEIAQRYDVHIQTHISETPDMVRFVETLHPNAPSHRCTALLDSHGLLTEKTVLAHGVYLRDAEVATLAERGSAVACCPLSNMLLSRGVLPMERFHQKGLRIGLGTDIAGGWDSSMLSAIRYATIAARTEDFISNIDRTLPADAPNKAENTSRNEEVFRKDDSPVVNHVYGFYMATVGGARALRIENKVGLFEVGMKFDAMLVGTQMGDEPGPLMMFPGDKNKPEILFEKFVCLGDDRNIHKVWVNGKCVWKK